MFTLWKTTIPGTRNQKERQFLTFKSLYLSIYVQPSLGKGLRIVVSYDLTWCLWKVVREEWFSYLACSSSVLSFPDTWKVCGYSSLWVSTIFIPSMPTLVRTVNLEPTKLNFGTQYNNMLLNCKKEEYTLKKNRKARQRKVTNIESSPKQKFQGISCFLCEKIISVL